MLFTFVAIVVVLLFSFVVVLLFSEAVVVDVDCVVSVTNVVVAESERFSKGNIVAILQ